MPLYEASKKSWKRLDPRFSVVDIGFKNGSPRFQVEALEPITLTIEPLKDHELYVKSKFEQLIDHGSTAAFSSDEIRIHGSPIFSEGGQIEIQMESANQFDAEVKLISVDPAGH